MVPANVTNTALSLHNLILKSVYWNMVYIWYTEGTLSNAEHYSKECCLRVHFNWSEI